MCKRPQASSVCSVAVLFCLCSLIARNKKLEMPLTAELRLLALSSISVSVLNFNPHRCLAKVVSSNRAVSALGPAYSGAFVLSEQGERTILREMMRAGSACASGRVRIGPGRVDSCPPPARYTSGGLELKLAQK